MKAKLGDIVQVTLYDHSQTSNGQGALMLMEVFGRITEVTKLSVVVTSWMEKDGPSNENNESFSIILSAIKSLKVLK